jgi:hypothetical protein
MVSYGIAPCLQLARIKFLLMSHAPGKGQVYGIPELCHTRSCAAKGNGHAGKDFDNVKMQRIEVEPKLLLLAFLICLWAAAGLIRPGVIPSQMSVANIATIGLLLTLWCSGKGPHAAVRTAILSAGFGVDCAAFLLSKKNVLLAVLCAALSLICVCGALAQYRKTRREAGGPVIGGEEQP